MKTWSRTVTAALGLAAVLAVGSAVHADGAYEAPLDIRADGPAKFVVAPRAEKLADGVKLTFEVSAATDVEVAVLDAQGRVVRHLAAGLLGKNAPAPLRKNALRQELLWDGKDDAGLPAGPDGERAVGPFRFRVRIGSTANFKKHLGWDGNALGPISSLTVGADGEVFALVRSWVGRGRTELRVLDRHGRYLRTIMPYSAETPAERTASVGHLMVDGQRLPVVFNGHGHSLYPLTVGMPRQNMAWNPRGHVVAVSTLATPFEHGLPRHLLAFDPNGGAPADVRFVGPELRPPTGITWGHGEGDDPCFDHVAVSPDGKWIYYTHSTDHSLHAVYRLAWGEPHGSGMEAGWFGQDNRPGGGERSLNGPQGLAVDAQGRVYICDRGNNRVVVVSPEGAMLGSIAIDDPEQIGVHARTGEIFVYCRQAPAGNRSKDIGPMSMAEYRAWRARVAERQGKLPPPAPPRLVKLSAWGGQQPPRELARLEVDLGVMALDPTSAPARLWASVRNRLLPIDDRDGELLVGKPVDDGDGLSHPGHVVLDPPRNRALLYQLSSNFRIFALDLTSGARSTLLEGLSDFAIAPDGSIYGPGPYNSRLLRRYSADGKPLPFPGGDSHEQKIAPFWVGGVNLGARGVTVGPNGDIYLLRANTENAVQSRLDVFGPDGALKKAALIDGLGIGDCGVGVDAAGNIYLGVNVKPANRLYQDGFEDKLPATNWLCWAQWNWHYRPAPWYYSMRNEYLYHWGSVMKFGPDGGAFYGRGTTEYGRSRDPAPVARTSYAPDGAADYMSGYLYHPVKAVGAQWRYAGMGAVPSSERQWGDPSCVCIASRLSVDPYGRVLMPNVFRFCVELLDPAGNLIARVGRYGNADDAGLSFAWPAWVSIAGELLAVSDSANRRVTMMELDYAATAECPAP